MSDIERKRILKVVSIMAFLNIILIFYLTYFQIFQAENIKQNPYNKRLWADEQEIIRGSFYDRNNNVLAYSIIGENDNIERVYKYDYLYSHIIGYSFREYGKAGLEKTYNSSLIGNTNTIDINNIKNLIGNERQGNDIVLTIDHDIQQKSRELLLGKKGSIITMNPKTGEIYSMVSMPDFNVNNLANEWENIIENPNSPLLNRATQGLYPPGSTFKIVTALSSLQNDSTDTDYICTGSIIVDGYRINDYDGKNHGNVGLEDAFIESCNTYFAEASLRLGHDKILETAENFYFNKKIQFDLDLKQSSFPTNDMTKTELAASGIGQGRILVTPLEMLMVTSAIANDGNIVKPHLVSKILSYKGDVIETRSIEILNNVGNYNDVKKIQDMMIDAVRIGTGKNAKLRDITVAGKTGTAENSSGLDHAWFVGYAPAENPKIAVVVLLEEEGATGGRSAAPIAKDLIEFSLQKLN
ncbi:MAG: penicillin-binding protein A [Tissierellales bacterium]|nr:penicillin-binding protein A [Tissierellales bacterium]